VEIGSYINPGWTHTIEAIHRHLLWTVEVMSSRKSGKLSLITDRWMGTNTWMIQR